MSRTTKIRPEIPTIVEFDKVSDEEAFQNSILRPIIKMQHDLLITYYQNYLEEKKQCKPNFTEESRIQFIQKSFQNDLNLKAELKGLIIGHFTKDELISYIPLKHGLNKRILTIIKERVLSSLDELS